MASLRGLEQRPGGQNPHIPSIFQRLEQSSNARAGTMVRAIGIQIKQELASQGDALRGISPMPDYEALIQEQDSADAGGDGNIISLDAEREARRAERIRSGANKGLRVAAAAGIAAAGLHFADLHPAQAAPISTSHRIETTVSPDPVENVEGGMFYNETNGGASADQGYLVRGPMWDAYRSFGRESVWGPPVSSEYVDEVGRVSQAFQRGIFQLTIGRSGAVEKMEFANVFDQLSAKGKDGWLEAVRQIPPSRDWSSDAGKPWEGVVANHLAVLDENPAIKRAFLSNPNWLEQYGLPMAMEDKGDQVVMRAQRGAFQQWKVAVPWAAAGQVTIALGGDIAKEAGGIIPQGALVLQRKADSVIAQGGGSAETQPLNFELTINKTDSSPEQLARGTAWINETLTNMLQNGNAKAMAAATDIIARNPKNVPRGTPQTERIYILVSPNAAYDGPIRTLVIPSNNTANPPPGFALQVLAEQFSKYPDPLIAQAEVYRQYLWLKGFMAILQERGQLTNYDAARALWTNGIKTDQAIKNLDARATTEAVALLKELRAQRKG